MKQSIRNRVLINSTVIACSIIMMIIISVLGARESEVQAKKISILTNQAQGLNIIDDYIGDFLEHFENYHSVGAEIYAVALSEDVPRILKSLKDLDNDSEHVKDLSKKFQSLEKVISIVLNTGSGKLSNHEKNDTILHVYELVRSIKKSRAIATSIRRVEMQEAILLQIKIVRMAVLKSIVVGGIGFLLYLFLGLIYSVNLSKDIMHLKNASISIAQGDYQPSLDVKRKDEVGDLAEALGSMAFRIMTNLSDLAKREKELQLFRHQIDNSNDAVFILEPSSGKFLDVNIRACVSLGYNREELLNLSVIDVDADITDTLTWNEHFKEIKEKVLMVFEGREKHKNGKIFPVEISAKYLSMGPQQEFIIATVRDITERKQMEEQLNQSEKLQAIGQLAGGIAHDFNNQLVGIMGYAEILSSKITNPEHRGFAAKILTAANNAAELTKHLLAFGRKGKNLLLPLDVHQVIPEVIAVLERSIDKRISLSMDLKANPSYIMGDPTQIENAVLNLCINARDAMPDGGELSIETKSLEIGDEFIKDHQFKMNPGQYLYIKISDTGIGMSSDTKGRIFEPFFTTKEVGKGTGLGLSSVYGTVKNHDGFIYVDSVIGQGTSFHIYFPPTVPVVSENTVPEKGVTRGSAQILVAEDMPIIQEIVALTLTELGYKVTTVDDGEAAINIYREKWREIDLVILDMIMPGLNGADTFNALKEINPKVRVIISSGYSLNGGAQALLDKGAKAFIGKPYKEVELSEKVAQVLSEDL